MATYLTTTSELTAVADAIRAKAGTQSALTYPSEFVSTISAITVGGGGLPAGSYGVEVTSWYVNPNSGMALPKDVTLTCSTQTWLELYGQGLFANGIDGSGSNYWRELKTVSSITVDSGTIDKIPSYMFSNTDLSAMPAFNYSDIRYVDAYAFKGIGQGGGHDGQFIVNLPNIATVGQYAFESNKSLGKISLGTYGNSNLNTIGQRAFRYCNNCYEIDILETPLTIGSNAFQNVGTASGLTPVINVVWSQGTVSGEPWGFTGTINYDYVPTP